MKTGIPAVMHAPKVIRPDGFLKRLLFWILDLDDEATIEAGRRRLRSSPGFFASLPPETLEYIKSYDGPENHGPPLTRRERRDLERRRSA